MMYYVIGSFSERKNPVAARPGHTGGESAQQAPPPKGGG
jgi:hypothetical protein